MKQGRRVYSTAIAIAIALGLVGSIAYGGVFNTKHNLSATGVNAASNDSGTREISVFCHTPHGANATAAVPFFNRNLFFCGFYTYYQLCTTRLVGAIEPVGSVSVACL